MKRWKAQVLALARSAALARRGTTLCPTACGYHDFPTTGAAKDTIKVFVPTEVYSALHLVRKCNYKDYNYKIIEDLIRKMGIMI